MVSSVGADPERRSSSEYSLEHIRSLAQRGMVRYGSCLLMTTQDLRCPMCEHDSLTLSTYSDTFQHRGADLVVEGLECYVCDECGADPVFEDQIRRNHVRVVDARRRADGLLTGREILALRKSLGLSQRDASEVFGGGANAFSKYERGEVAQSVAMDRLLRLVARYPLLLDDVRRHTGMIDETGIATGAVAEMINEPS